jgi:TctA family transporter
MELFDNLALGFATASTLWNLLFCLIGVLLGTLIGVLPGIGATATIAMLLPITFQIGDPVSSLIMLAGIYYGAQYGGSTTAILINMPGESSSAVTAIDGYQMARNGRAGAALAIAAIGSFFAGTVSTFLVALFAPPLTAIALEFGSAEYFSLMVVGLVSSIALAHGSIIKAMGMVVLGLLLGLVGTDIYTGTPRFTLGIREYADGLNFVAVAVGVFGIAEILRNLENEHERSALIRKVSGLMPTREDFRRMAAPIIRGTVIGSALGILPGGGAILAAFASYTVEKRVSDHPEEFGKGAIAGVAGPESANNAGAQTSFIPMLTLGIPANPVMALMIGAMIIQHRARSQCGYRAACPLLGHHSLDVDRQPDADRPQSAADRAMGEAPDDPLLCALPDHHGVLLDRRLQRQFQRLRPLRGRVLRPRRLPAREVALRARATTARLRSRAVARGKSPSGNDSFARRPDHLRHAATQRVPAGYCARRARHRFPTGRQKEARRSVRGGELEHRTR